MLIIFYYKSIYDFPHFADARSLLASLETAADNLGLVIAAKILFDVGYFSLLYSSYTLVLDR